MAFGFKQQNGNCKEQVVDNGRPTYFICTLYGRSLFEGFSFIKEFILWFLTILFIRFLINTLILQIEREPRPFPTLRFKRKVTDIDDFQFDDFILEGYKPHPKIKMDMAVWFQASYLIDS